jgi:hypothetical protein
MGLAMLTCANRALSQTADSAAKPAEKTTVSESGLVIEHAKLNTADASPVDPEHYEVEMGYSWTQAKRAFDADGDTHQRELAREQAVGLALTVGLVPNVDVNIGLDYLWLRDDDNVAPTTGEGLGDLCFGGRYRFFTSEHYGIEAAWITGVTVPTGSDGSDDELGVSQEFWSWDNSLVVTKDLERLTMNAEVGWSQPLGEDRGDDRGTLIANLAAGYQILEWLQPEVELNYSRKYANGEADESALAVTAGLVMPINDCLRVNLGVQQAVWGENADKATAAMLAVKLGF